MLPQVLFRMYLSPSCHYLVGIWEAGGKVCLDVRIEVKWDWYLASG